MVQKIRICKLKYHQVSAYPKTYLHVAYASVDLGAKIGFVSSVLVSYYMYLFGRKHCERIFMLI